MDKKTAVIVLKETLLELNRTKRFSKIWFTTYDRYNDDPIPTYWFDVFLEPVDPNEDSWDVLEEIRTMLQNKTGHAAKIHSTEFVPHKEKKKFVVYKEPREEDSW
ncbi:MAG: hypothetical protein P0Y53_18465 [Candidatus Pseudobacter hemicellulosilyticus]|uniref:Uncharacterized protein n=1 Tax=Candidatus Pseudobacter hemicellulosilyticus TaxID=3121375 RepID=A0AAJ6BED5_9BACT|nr:MAG: hypothetical protein P0Y53_18465 [Pseudobacter sp.]